MGICVKCGKVFDAMKATAEQVDCNGTICCSYECSTLPNEIRVCESCDRLRAEVKRLQALLLGSAEETAEQFRLNMQLLQRCTKADADLYRLRKELSGEKMASSIALARLRLLEAMAKRNGWTASNEEKAELLSQCISIAAGRGEG